MPKIYSATDLRNAILELEARLASEGKILKEQFLITYESLKPVNLIKKTFTEIGNSPELKNNIINTSIGLATGYISKILFEQFSGSPFKKLIGSVLMFGISNAVAKNPGGIKLIGNNLFKIISNKLNQKMNGSDKPESRKAVTVI